MGVRPSEIEVKIMESNKELSALSPLYVEHLLWGTKEVPRTYAYMGFVPKEGIYLRMICEEKEPRRIFTEDNEPVYQDSAMEAFFLFESDRERNGRPTYINFEFNANGALLASYGQERKYRSYFTKEEIESFQCHARIKEDRWSVDILVPITILEHIYGPLNLEEGSYFAFNLYKISESPEIEHYASYAPVKSLVPSFHLPEFFAEARIVE